MLSYESISELYKTAEALHKRIREIVLEDQAAQLEQPEEALIRQMEENLTVMLEAIENGSKPGVKSAEMRTGLNRQSKRVNTSAAILCQMLFRWRWLSRK